MTPLSLSFLFPQRHIVVKLLSRGTQWTSGSPIEVVQGEVRIGKELSTFQNLLKDWFYTCAVVGVALLFSLQVVMWTVAHVWVDWRRQLALVEDDSPHDASDTVNGGHTDIFHDDDNNDDDEWDDMPAPEEANNEANRTPNLANEHHSENETAPMTTTMDDDNPAQCNSDEAKEEEEEESRPDTRVQGEDELLDMFTDHDPLDFQSVQ
jgi:hypothetical protein